MLTTATQQKSPLITWTDNLESTLRDDVFQAVWVLQLFGNYEDYIIAEMWAGDMWTCLLGYELERDVVGSSDPYFWFGHFLETAIYGEDP